MASKTCLILVFFLILSCLAVQSHGIGKRRQGDLLGNLYKTKRVNGTDTTLFEIALELDFSKLCLQKGIKETDRISRLPGQPPVSFSQYGGYVTVDKSDGRAMYYYFVEAENHHKKSLPLLLWLNGGPGCSSLGYGAMEELGPFRVYSDGKTLYRNKYSWSNVANVLFLESPAGVGFSYSNTTSNYNASGDRQTAEDNYVFLVNWLERFPEYKDREFYIAGESYAGHYVPQLAHYILYHNKIANKTIINFKGFMIGNAAINDETDNLGMYEFFASHAIISNEELQEIKQQCDFSREKLSNKCNEVTNKADKNVDYIDIYNIYGPLCFNDNLTVIPRRTSIRNFDPCSDDYVYAYLNRPEVQAAMHANVTKLEHDWQPCSNIIVNWNDSPSTTIPLIQESIASGLRVWVFSGDNDGRVPVTSTQLGIDKMNLSIKTEWRPWVHKGEVGGYSQVYKGKGELTFATVRGAGHEVPSFQPERALVLIKHFLAGTHLPQA